MNRIALRLGTTVSLIGLVAFFVSALTMVGFWIIALTEWLGWIGTVVGVLAAPAAVAYPFVYWIVEQAPRALHFWIWGGGVVGLIVAMTWVGMRYPGDDLAIEVEGTAPPDESAEERTA